MKFRVAAKKVINRVVDKILVLFLTIGIKKIDTRTLYLDTRSWYWENLLEKEMLRRNREFLMDCALKDLHENTTKIFDEMFEEQQKEVEHQMRRMTETTILFALLLISVRLRRIN